MSARPTIYFQGGTLVLNDVDQNEQLPDSFQWIKSHWRCEAYYYPYLKTWLKENDIRDTIPRWKRLDLTLHDSRNPHKYQNQAIKAWKDANYLGSIVLPTGSGKTFVAIHAIYHVKRSTLVIAPTIDLLHQWYARLRNAFNSDVGVYYGAEKLIEPITVTTYHSAGDLVADYGNEFKLIIFDEVHHLPAPRWGETALMSPSLFRLGLTATYPEDHEQLDDRWRIEDLIGPVIYEKRIDELTGATLAEYRTERIRIDLTEEEREQYDAHFAVYSNYFRTHKLQRDYGPDWLFELMRRSAFDRDARRALLARHNIIKLLGNAGGKFAILENLLKEHFSEKVLIFTENNDVAYKISRQYLIPVITHQTKAAERKEILENFLEGSYQAIVTSRVLNEGVDVPEAKVAIVLGGTTSAREYVQRLGRVLRKVGNREAVLYEIIARNTIEENRSQRRRKGSKRYVNR